MQPKGIIILFGMALLLGWFLPEADPLTLPKPAATTKTDEAVFNTVRSQTLEDAVETVLERQSDGHFYADADIDGTEIRFMVDTGASGIALTASDAEALGLSWSNSELRKVGRGASGDVYGKPVRLRSVQLGDLEANDVEAAIIPQGLDVSLLGQSVLSKAGSIKIEDDQMVIR